MIHENPTHVLEDSAIQALAASLRGAVLRPGDAGYEQALHIYNGMIDKHPALIARCVDVADVIAAVNFAREHELTWRCAAAATVALGWAPATTVW